MSIDIIRNEKKDFKNWKIKVNESCEIVNVYT